jgi:hypothetical protein
MAAKALPARVVVDFSPTGWNDVTRTSDAEAIACAARLFAETGRGEVRVYENEPDVIVLFVGPYAVGLLIEADAIYVDEDGQAHTDAPRLVRVWICFVQAAG